MPTNRIFKLTLSCARRREAVRESSGVEFLLVFRHISKSCFVYTKLPSNFFFLYVICFTQSELNSVVYTANFTFFTEFSNLNMKQFRSTITGFHMQFVFISLHFWGLSNEKNPNITNILTVQLEVMGLFWSVLESVGDFTLHMMER